jgi:hypothetical protein
MTFDEQITQAFDTLTARLRGEIDREVERRAEELAAALAAARVEEPVPSQVEAPVPSDVEGPVADASVSLDRLARGFDAIDAAGSLTAILDALLAFAVDDAPDASVWLIRGGQPHRWRAALNDQDPDDTLPRSLDDGIPLAIAGQTVAVLIANSALSTQHSERGTQHSALSLMARYAAKSLESMTAFTTARALTQPRATGISESRLQSSDSEEETSAKRYARLLVSEIKLYHEPAVVDGRRDRDLATRLGGEIARARVMYEERVPATVRQRRDYFQEELVRTLADGDSSLFELRT